MPDRDNHVPLGAWPRGLSSAQAAAYTGVGKDQFLSEVKDGIWPEPYRRGRRNVWDRREIDDAWDSLSKDPDSSF